jgi:peptidyl-tRNA hydrolase ICT1
MKAAAAGRAAAAPLRAPSLAAAVSAARPQSSLLPLLRLVGQQRPLSTSPPPRASADQDTQAPPISKASSLPPQRHLPELPQLPAPIFLRPLCRADVEVAFSRSSGAGGQNVNKVSTKVDMRWDVGAADWVPDEVKGALRHMEKNRFTGGRAKGGGGEATGGGGADGGGGSAAAAGGGGGSAVIAVSASRHRTQRANLDDALERLQAMLDAAVAAVTPRESDPEAVKRVAKA